MKMIFYVVVRQRYLSIIHCCITGPVIMLNGVQEEMIV